MDDRIRDYCRLGIVHYMLYKDTITGGGDHSSLISLLESPEFDAVECAWINDDAMRAAVTRCKARNGKTIAFGAHPVLLTQDLDLNSLDEDHRRRAVSAVRAVVPQAYELGATGFALLSGPATGEADRARATDRLVRSLTEIADTLADRGAIPLVLVSFDQLDYGKNRLIGPNRAAAAVAREVRKSHPSFGLMLDLSHLPLQGETPREAWDAAGEFVVHAHMGNCVKDKPGHPLNGDTHPPLCDPAGENCVAELAEYLQVLLDGGFLNRETRPVLSFEVSPHGEWTPDVVVEHSLATLEEAWEIVKAY